MNEEKKEGILRVSFSAQIKEAVFQRLTAIHASYKLVCDTEITIIEVSAIDFEMIADKFHIRRTDFIIWEPMNLPIFFS